MPGAQSTRDGDTGNEDNSSFARFFKLDKYAMFSFAMTSGLASDSFVSGVVVCCRCHWERCSLYRCRGRCIDALYKCSPCIDALEEN